MKRGVRILRLTLLLRPSYRRESIRRSYILEETALKGVSGAALVQEQGTDVCLTVVL